MPAVKRVPPVFCELVREELKRTLDYLLRNAPDGGRDLRAKATAFDNSLDPTRGRTESSYTGFLDGNMAKRTVERLRARFDHNGYYAGSMLVRPESKVAYQLLMSAVYHLNTPDEMLQPDSTDSGGQETPRSRLGTALHRFCRLLSPSCYTVYHWGMWTNKSTLLLNQGLRYPEAMQGFTWTHDVSREILFDDEARPALAEARDTPGTFRMREGFVQTCWPIHLRTDRMRLVLFLNWRSGESPRFADPVTGTDLPLTLKDVLPAVRYFAGWLATSGLAPTETLPGGLPKPPLIVEDAWNAAKFDGRFQAVGLLKSAVRHAIGITDCHVAVHWIVPNPESQQDCEVGLQFEDGDYVGYESRTPWFSITPNADGRVHKSISAQSAAWRAPILIENMQAPPGGFGVPPDLWENLDVKRRVRGRPYRTGSQLTVPIKTEGHLSAIINVESPERFGLTREHLRRTELVANLYGSLRTLRADGSATSLIDEICQTPHPKNTDDLLRRFTRCVCSETRADLCYVLLYDHLARVLRPNGISACRELVARVLNTSHDDFPCPVTVDDPHPLCLEFLGRYLIPRRRGRSWKCLVTAKPNVIWNTKTETPPPSRFTQDYFMSALGLPFPCPLSAISPQPNGVVWVRWKEQPTHLASDGQGLVDIVGRVVGRVSQAVSAVYEIYLHTEAPWHAEST